MCSEVAHPVSCPRPKQNGRTGRKRLLLVTYPFPPVGGAGVQRVTKFVKFLPSHAWDVSVLTVANPSVPLYDESLRKDIPNGVVIRRARSWEPSYVMKASVSVCGEKKPGLGVTSIRRFLAAMARRIGTLLLQPDAQVLWVPGAVKEGKRLLRQTEHDAILASGPPFSTFMIGASLSRFSRLPLVLDYRDEWTISNAYWENKRLDPLSRRVQSWMQHRVLRAAKGLVATTRSSARSLEELTREAGAKARTTWVYNGFDPDDFDPRLPEPRSEAGLFRLSYIGTLWNLTSVAPLVDAMKRVAREAPDVAAGIELVFAGRRTGPQAELLKGFRELPCQLVEHSYLEHSSAVELMRGSSALCLLLSDLPQAGRVVPAKLFEYMATTRQILTIAPPGEARELLEGYPGGQFSPGDVTGIATWLIRAVRQYREGAFRPAESCDVSAFTRENEARQLADFLDQLLPTENPPLV